MGNAIKRLSRGVVIVAIVAGAGSSVVAMEIGSATDMPLNNQLVLSGEKNLKLAVYKVKITSESAYIKQMTLAYEGTLPANAVFQKVSVDNGVEAEITENELVFDLEKMQSVFWNTKGTIDIYFFADLAGGLPPGHRFRLTLKSVSAMNKKAEKVEVVFDPVKSYTPYFRIFDMKHGLVFEQKQTAQSTPSPYEQYLLGAFRVASGTEEEVVLKSLQFGFFQKGSFKVENIKLIFQTATGTDTVWEGLPSGNNLTMNFVKPVLVDSSLDPIEQFQILISVDGFDAASHQLGVGLDIFGVDAQEVASGSAVPDKKMYNLPIRFNFKD